MRNRGSLAAQGFNFTPYTPTSVATTFDKLDFSRVPVWPDTASIMKMFLRIRDERFIQDPDHRLLRRSTWIYPDDGCYARAALGVMRMQKLQTPGAVKVFAFGNLTVKSVNNPAGYVSWWYHVVPLMMVGQQPWVFDPAIYPVSPIKLQDWVRFMSNDPRSVTLAVCSPGTFNPDSPCYAGMQSQEQNTQALPSQISFLPLEENRIRELGRDPSKELTTHPPWSNVTFPQ